MFHYLTLCYFVDEAAFRNLVLWVEDQKIRHYTIEDRTGLRNITSTDWPKSYKQVYVIDFFWCLDFIIIINHLVVCKFVSGT